ncbi:MAG: salicylyl-CoA 5-hydroxylase [Actinomycetia bacterium]|nr:salicylyl-CoA 5-hydroxylase [Actinomycetes bacterium]
MRVAVVGGGPGGLAAAVLLARGGHEVALWDRGSAPGLGLVLSGDALDTVRGVDAEIHARVLGQAARWDTIETALGGELYRAGGHVFAGIGRDALAAILRDRASALRVRLGAEPPPLDELAAGYDVVVAADGVHSAIRDSGPYGVTRQDGRNAYVWLGTDAPLPAFRFVLGPDGVIVHAYPHGPGVGTVVLEAPEPLADPLGVAGALLGGARVWGDPVWRSFSTISVGTWRAGNVVLLGDAAHTTHYSTGSGTKLAIEDAIALASALASEPSVPAALKAYEDARRPAVASAQRAALASQGWFEDLRWRLGTDPEELVFGLLTRSRRITHASLRARDPESTAAVEKRFGGSPPLLAPFTVRGLTLENRIVVSPTALYSADDGVPGDFHLVHLGARALGGAGLVMTEMVAVSPDARITLGCPGLWTDQQATAWRRITEFAHAQGTRIGVQLGHAGRKGSAHRPWDGGGPLAEGGWGTLGPSAIPFGSFPTPHEMTPGDLRVVRQDFVAAARRASEAGFDLLELHLAHGYLLSSFLTPLSNHRTDHHGGSLPNRARFPLDVLAAVREVWDGPLSARISATDWVDGGFTADDAVELARLLAAAGADLIDVSTGQTSSDARPAYGRTYQVPFSERIRRQAGVPTIAVGAISSADDVNTILLAGQADLCALGRPHLHDPAWTLHAAAENGWDVPWPVQYREGRASRPPVSRPAVVHRKSR